jgi:GDSL/SGNH-like Acyl-Esterase family found in Pmr5 and Cas1p
MPTPRGNSISSWLRNRPDLEYCIQHRGTRGHWYINETMGKEYFYALGPRSNKWKRDNQGNVSAVYPNNMYAWHDETEDSHGCRPIVPVNKQRFCSTLQQLGIERIFVVGDSLSKMQIHSLLSLLGYNVKEFLLSSKPDVNTTLSTIDCPNIRLEFQYRRENLGPNLRLTELGKRNDNSRKHRQQFGPEIPFCEDNAEYQYNHDGSPQSCPWMAEYQSSTKTTLLLLNQGAHFHSVETFQNSFDLFVKQLNAMVAHPKDIIVFRNTAPGHKDCFHVHSDAIAPPDLTHDTFLDRYGTTMYDWNLFDAYNQHAKTALSQISSNMTQTIRMYLNIYNMTILRPDGHSAEKDCLHYTSPGPADFWNHLLLTNLADLAAAAKETQGRMMRR